MFVWVFFENLGKASTRPAGYAGLINYYIKHSHSPAIWKAVMALAASHAAMAAPMQAPDRDLSRYPAGHRSVYPPGRIRGVSVSRQPLGFGVGHLMDLGTAGSGDGIARARCRTRRPEVGRGRVAGAAVAIVSVVVDLNQFPVRVSVIIPTHNEAVGDCARFSRSPAPISSPRSSLSTATPTDGTPAIAAKNGGPRRSANLAADTASVPYRAGRGKFSGRGCFLDGDYSDRPSELPILLAPIIEGRADITLGSRLHGAAFCRGLALASTFGNRLAAGLIRLLYGLNISDLGPFRAAAPMYYARSRSKKTTYGWAVEMILKGALAGFRVVEVPVSYYRASENRRSAARCKARWGAGGSFSACISALLLFRRSTEKKRHGAA